MPLGSSLRVLVGLAFAACATTITLDARAHDQWLLPSTFVAPYGGEPITVRLFVGEDWRIESERGLLPERIVRFRVTGVTGRTDLASQVLPNTQPLARVDHLREGIHVIALDLTPAFLELPAEKFESYLREEGLEAIVAQRAARGESKHSGRERYQRSLKAVVQVGEKRDASAATIVGSDLELLPSSIEPRRLSLDVRFQGKPLPDLLVELVTRQGDDVTHVAKVSAKTNARGSVSLDVPKAGTHLVRAVHMIRCEECDDVEWQSYWSSLVYASPTAPIEQARTSPSMTPTGRAERVALSLALALVVLGAGAWFVRTTRGR